MILLSTLAKNLEAKLNGAIATSLLPYFHANTDYSFVVYSDVGQYKAAVKKLNTVKKYINCCLRLNGDEKAGVTNETVSAVWSAQLECLIPSPLDEAKIEEDGELKTYRIADAVESLINDTFASSTQEYISDSDGIMYYLGGTYSNTVAGDVDLRGGVGESLPVSVFINFTVIAAGLSSANIVLELLNPATAKYERIYPTRLDIMRTAVQEGNLASDEDGVSKVTTQGTMLTIQITKPLRNDNFDTILKAYIIAPSAFMGNNGGLYSFRLSIPTGFTENNEIEVLSDQYYLTFADASISAETNLAAACTAKLVEALDIS